MKPRNIVYEERADGTIFVRLIDFGGVLPGTKFAQQWTDPITYTRLYKAHEIKLGFAMASPWWSYDIFAVGLIYIRLVCPSVKVEGVWKALAKHEARAVVGQLFSENYIFEEGRYKGNRVCPVPPQRDVDLIVRMLDRAPSKRPSPWKCLNTTVLAPYVKEDALVVENLPKPNLGDTPASIEGAFWELRELNRKERIQEDGKEKKCCCRPDSGECKLVDVNENPKCAKMWGKESCKCLVGEGWSSYRKLSLQECIITKDNREEEEEDEE